MVNRTIRRSSHRNTSEGCPETRSNLERVFNFDNPAFRRYMVDERDGQTIITPGPDNMLVLHYEMANSELPLVRYAAGWAAAEAALSSEPYPAENRSDALKKANVLWGEAAAMFFKDRTSGEAERPHENLGFELAAVKAMCNLPVMETAAALAGGIDLQPHEKQRAIDKTACNLREFGKVLRTEIVDERELWNLKSTLVQFGALYETVALMTLQYSKNNGYLFVPASLRQDNSQFSHVRADIIGLPTSSQGEKVLVQVKSQENPDTDYGGSDRVNIFARPDLILDDSSLPLETLDIFLDKYAAPNEQVRLDALSMGLDLRVKEFDAQRQTAA